jgi:outer membrane protein OmpA-like peptidoglycan-associated protein
MKKSMLVFAAAGLLALPGAATAQQEGQRGWWSGWGNYSAADCPQPKRTAVKITEDQARDLAQKYADKNFSGYKVEKPIGYGGGYETTCYQMASDGAYQILHSVEYSIDVTTSRGDRRNLRVDQFGNVTPFSGPFVMAGAQGAAGRDGPGGPAGAQGAAGRDGQAGLAGAQGAAGRDGQAGLAGAQGPAGLIGMQGPAGPVGAQGMAGAIQHWASFKNFLFDTDKSDIRPNEMSKVAEIAAYMQQNSSAKVGLDGHADPRGDDAYNQALSERRVNVIRDALAKAGVPGDRIHTGAFGESQVKCLESTEACWQRDRRVEVLIGTDIASR